MGLAIRLLRALIDYLIERHIEIIPRFVRSGRNFSRYHLSRADAKGSPDWARIANTQQVGIHEARFALVDSWEPEVEFLELGRFDIPRTLRSWERMAIGCEWRPGGYGFAAALGKIGGKCFSEEPLHSRVQKQMVSWPEWNGESIDLMCGMVWAEYELADFAFSIQKSNRDIL